MSEYLLTYSNFVEYIHCLPLWKKCMSALEKNVTSDWFMMSNILKIKSLRWCISLKNNSK